MKTNNFYQIRELSLSLYQREISPSSSPHRVEQPIYEKWHSFPAASVTTITTAVSYIARFKKVTFFPNHKEQGARRSGEKTFHFLNRCFPLIFHAGCFRINNAPLESLFPPSLDKRYGFSSVTSVIENDCFLPYSAFPTPPVLSRNRVKRM